jgi:replicative DNA helicase
MSEKHIIDNLKKFGSEFQVKCISGLVSDRPFIERISDIVEADFFESDAHQWIVKESIKYFNEYRDLPTLNVFKVKLEVVTNEVLKKSIVDNLKLIYQKMNDGDLKFIKEEFLEFCINQKLKNAIMESVDYLKIGQYEKIKTKFDEALKAGMERNIGHDYGEDVEKRMTVMARSSINTKWEVIDGLMDGGLGPGELGIITACAGSGKSWVLCKLGAEAMKQGKNVIHFTLELNENYVGLRYDACFTGIDFQNIRNNISVVREKIAQVPGKLIIKYFPIKTVSAHSLKAHCERLAMLGTKVDMIIVDYADILRPINSDRNSNSYQEAGGIYEELRAVAGELQVPIWSASQSNRAAMEEDIIQANNISDSYRKIMTADFVMSLSRKVNDKVSNTARFHIIKNRFGPDGLTFPSKMNAGCGQIEIFSESSREGLALQNEMMNGENQVKKALKNKWNAHSSSEDGDE